MTPSEDLVPGTVFLPCGPHANAILHANTHGTGAPDYKWMEGSLALTDALPRSGWDILVEQGGAACPRVPEPGREKGNSTPVYDVVCPLCGCLCDDLVAWVEGNIITAVDNACAMGSEKFLSRSRLTTPILRSGGSWAPIKFNEAIRYAAEVLGNAERPVLFGWSGTSSEAQCTGIHIAEEIRGVIDNCSSICHGPSIMGIQEVGHPGCSLGVVKNRADVVIYWGSNPIESHPRHLSRYTTFVNGRYRDNGHQDRTLVVVDIRKTDTAKIADEFIRSNPAGIMPFFSPAGDHQGHADIIPLKSRASPERLVWLADLRKMRSSGRSSPG